MNELNKEIIIYKAKDSQSKLEVTLRKETVWLSQAQLSDLFATERSVITKHLRNVFNSKELNEEQVCANFAHTADDGKTYKTQFYNLDAIISVGYRVNSKRGTQFRIWATQVLKERILRGAVKPVKQLKKRNDWFAEFQKATNLVGRLIDERELEKDEAIGLLKVITDYSLALSLLDKYDHQKLVVRSTTSAEQFVITYEKAKEAIVKMAEESGMGKGGLFAREKDQSFKSSLGAIYQTFGGKELYPSIEEKAANLLYFVVKNHSFVDGNKRIGAFLFIWFMNANGILYGVAGKKRIGDNALVALTLMIAESKPADKDIICKVIVNLINKENL